MIYQERVVDQQLGRILAGLPAVSLEGAKGVGKTATAQRRAQSVVQLDRQAIQANVIADPELVLALPTPLLLDEWHLVPPLWDVVRRAVDDDRTQGRFLLTGSAMPPKDARIHSGAGRIVRLMMHPMTLPERGVSQPTVSLADLLSGEGELAVSGQTDFALVDYAQEIVRSGFPGLRDYAADLIPEVLDSYVDQILAHDIPELGVDVRRPHALRAWLASYGAATSTTAKYSKILDAATPGEANKPSSSTATAYRELLQRMWVLEPLPAWVPAFNPLKRLAQSPKHHLVDPAIAASLLGSTPHSLLMAMGETGGRREGTLLAALFESLAVLSVRVFAQAARAKVFHLRTQNGDHEIDMIVELPNHRVLAIEVKLGSRPQPSDSKHLAWLASVVGDQLVDRVLITTGTGAYRDSDGVAVVPLALLGP